jgi:hypothetical protein
MNNIFERYELGLSKLLERLGQDHPRYGDTLVFQQRLEENIAQSRRYGDTKTHKAERAEIIEGVNQLARDVIGTSFNQLCGLDVLALTTDVAYKIPILFLAADPTDASRLRLGEELREIQEKLQLAKLRERFELHQRMSVRPADISQALLDIQPKVVHFSGHGMATGALCFENQVGETHPIQPDALAALFEQFTNQVSCVILNACYSEIQATAIAKHIDYVIGMNQAIGDKTAIAFAVGFYQALGASRTTEEAHKLGCVQIRLQGIPEHLTPILIKKGQMQS